MEPINKEDREKAVKKIKELFELISPIEQCNWEALLLTIEIRENLNALLNDKNPNSRDIQAEIELARKKKEALKDLMEMNETMKKIFDEMSPDEQANFNSRGSGIKKIIQQKSANNLKERNEQREQARKQIEERANGSVKSIQGEDIDLLDQGSDGVA